MIGYLMLASLFFVFFAFVLVNDGLKTGILIVASSVVITLFIAIAGWLIEAGI